MVNVYKSMAYKTIVSIIIERFCQHMQIVKMLVHRDNELRVRAAQITCSLITSLIHGKPLVGHGSQFSIDPVY